MQQQHNHKNIVLSLEVLLSCFSDRDVFIEAGKIQFAQNIAFNGHQRQVLQSVLAHCGSQSTFN